MDNAVIHRKESEVQQCEMCKLSTRQTACGSNATQPTTTVFCKLHTHRAKPWSMQLPPRCSLGARLPHENMVLSVCRTGSLARARCTGRVGTGWLVFEPQIILCRCAMRAEPPASYSPFGSPAWHAQPTQLQLGSSKAKRLAKPCQTSIPTCAATPNSVVFSREP